MREANHKMTLRELIPYIDYLTNIKVIQMDAYVNSQDEEEIYTGSVLDVPWWITEMYLHIDKDGESIFLRDPEYITIYVVMDPNNTEGGR